MISEMCRPVRAAHSLHASECRDPETVLEFYQASALGRTWMDVMQETAVTLLDIQLLARIGFTTEFNSIPKGPKTVDPLIQAETANAMTMVDLFCGIAFNRISSMLWHSRGLPGYLALLASPDDDIFRKALQ